MNKNMDGPFKDFKNQVSTDDLNEWRRYMAEDEHGLTTRGFGPCIFCGKPETEFVHTGCIADLAHPPAICESCRLQHIANAGPTGQALSGGGSSG